MPYGTKEIRRWPPLHCIIRTEYHLSPAFSHFPGPWMRSVPVVWINIVLAPKSCNFPEVAVGRALSPSFQFPRYVHTWNWNGLYLPAVRMGPLHLFNHETTNEASPVLFRTLTEYEISLPRVNEWHLFLIPFLKPLFHLLDAVKKMCHLEKKLASRREGGPPLSSQMAATGLLNILTPI